MLCIEPLPVNRRDCRQNWLQSCNMLSNAFLGQSKLQPCDLRQKNSKMAKKHKFMAVNHKWFNVFLRNFA